MKETPRLIAPLWLAGPGHAVSVGEADLTLAAAAALASGGLWDSEVLPPTFNVLCRLGHAGRQAVLRGMLSSPGLPDRYAAFAREAAAWGTPEGIRMVLVSAEKAAHEVARAAWLLQTVSGATVEAWPSPEEDVVHPVTGDREPAGIAAAWTRPPGPPFAFATLRLKFGGIEWEELRDFLSDGGRAVDFLALCVRDPRAAFNGVDDLDLLAGADDGTGTEAVLAWNARQDVWLRAADYGRIAVPRGGGRRDAERWCRDDLSLAAFVRDSLAPGGR